MVLRETDRTLLVIRDGCTGGRRDLVLEDSDPCTEDFAGPEAARGGTTGLIYYSILYTMIYYSI